MNAGPGYSYEQEARRVCWCLQEDKGEWPTQHLAFTVDADEIERAAAALREHGVTVRGPVFHAWMPATSVYFTDPDGHQLELCAPTHKP